MKITKEHAEFLIGRLDKIRLLGNELKSRWDMPDDFVAWLHLKEIINHFTEKEFPDINITTPNDETIIILKSSHEKHIRIFMDADFSVAIDLTFDELEELAGGISKICQWIKEQE